ncbi:MAG: cytochrome C oxidase subunit IV family protein [Chloroflexota bacterium]|jgi:cytochrome c oxidase subunit 4|nr:cytochrome C oxidase subunit IV family protein [Chloroflexota bacterium]
MAQNSSFHPQPGHAEHGAEEHAHPGERQYINIAIFLAIVTGIEVAIYYIEALDSILVPALVLLSAIKFVFVVGYFMHLKFDDRRLGLIFGSALAVALAVFLVVWVLLNANEISIFFGGQ